MPVVINGTTGITNVNGSAAAPAETGTDTDTGIYYGTNTVGLATNGTAALQIDSSQNVSLTAGLAVAGNNISAVNSMGFRNRIINGAMVVSQYYGTNSTTTSGYIIDRFYSQISSGTFTFQQTTSVVPAGFAYAESITVTSVGTRNAADYFNFSQNIEGLNVADLGFGAAGAVTVTLSFWVRSSVTGTYSGVLASGDNTRTYAFTYSVPSANTWTQISVTIAGDTSGGQTAYPINNNAGLRLKLDLGSGSNYQMSAGSWQAAANKIGTSSQVGWAQTAGATFYITGVQLEAGSVATPFERRDYGRELIMCQRYFFNRGGNQLNEMANIGSFQAYSTSNAAGNLIFPVQMRAAPTLTVSANSDWNITTAGYSAISCTGISIFQVGVMGCQLIATIGSASLTAGNASNMQAANINARLNLSAEL